MSFLNQKILMFSIIFHGVMSFAQLEIPANMESYLEARPSIYDVTAGTDNFKNLLLKDKPQVYEKSWSQRREALLYFCAFLLEAYPQSTHFYFLARDSEFLYDLMKLLVQNTDREGHMHLLNVSRLSLHDKNLPSYLKQNGLTEDRLQSGLHVLIDSGMLGTIPNGIKALYSKPLQKNLKGHFLVSESPNQYPSSYSYVSRDDPATRNIAPQLLSIWHFEGLPKFTERASHYLNINGLWHPLSLRQNKGKEDGVVNKQLALAIMQYMKAYAQNKKTMRLFTHLRNQLRWLIAVMTSSDSGRHQLLKEKIQQGANSPYGRLLVSQIRELESSSFNTGLVFKVSSQQLGIPSLINDSKKANLERTMELAKLTYPKWRFLLDNPERHIEALVSQQKWMTLKRFILARIYHPQIQESISKYLLDIPAGHGGKAETQLFYVKHGGDKALSGKFIRKVMALPKYEEWHKEMIMAYVQHELSATNKKYFHLWDILDSPNASRLVDLIYIYLMEMDATDIAHLRTSSLWLRFAREPWLKPLLVAIEIDDLGERQRFLAENYVIRDFLLDWPAPSMGLSCRSVFAH